MSSLHQKQRVRNKTFPVVYCNIKNPWSSRCFRCFSSWDIKIKTQPVALIINKLKIMQIIFTFFLEGSIISRSMVVIKLHCEAYFIYVQWYSHYYKANRYSKLLPSHLQGSLTWTHDLQPHYTSIFVCRGLQFWQHFSFSRCPLQPKFIEQCNFGFTPNTPT